MRVDIINLLGFTSSCVASSGEANAELVFVPGGLAKISGVETSGISVVSDVLFTCNCDDDDFTTDDEAEGIMVGESLEGSALSTFWLV